MSQMTHILRREYLERVRSKWFVVMTVLGPIGMIALIVIPALIQAHSSQRTVNIGVVDDSAVFSTYVYDRKLPLPKMMDLRFKDVSGESSDEIKRRISGSELDGYLLIPKNVLNGGEVVYRGTNTSDVKLTAVLGAFLNQTAMMARARQQGLTDKQFAAIQLPGVPLTTKQLTRDGDFEDAQSGTALFILSFAWMFVLYMAIVVYGVNVMRSILEEKTTRVIEMIASCASPGEILIGKVLGVGLAALTQIAIWGTVALLLLANQEAVLQLFGMKEAIELPSMRVLDVLINTVFFVLGFFFYAALYAVVGAAVTTEQEAQQAQLPVIMLLVVPLLCVQLVADDPRGLWAEVLSMVPLSSPTTMPMRIVLEGASYGEVAMSLAILAAATFGVLALAIRIYTRGLMRFGSRASLRDLIRWLKK